MIIKENDSNVMDCTYDNFILFLKEKGIRNPWENVADLAVKKGEYYLPNAKYICREDETIIEEYNNLKRKSEHKFITDILPAPFDGDVFNAKIIILTLNPGFVENVNYILYNLLNENAKKEITNYSIDNLGLKGKKINPTDAVTFIGDRYWKNKTREIREQHNFTEEEIAIVQYIGYQSKEFYYNKKLEELKSIEFLKTLIEFIIKYRKDDYCFVICRNNANWKKILSKNLPTENLYNKYVTELKNYRNTTISKGNIVNWDLIERIKVSKNKTK